MERFVKRDVVVVPFPFSDLTQTKRRPALVVSSLKGDDLILCQITSQNVRDDYAITFDDQDMSDGKLDKTSNIRPNRLFTADHHIVLYRIGCLASVKTQEVIERLVNIIEHE